MTYQFNGNFKKFRQNITPSREQLLVLTNARKEVRTHIRQTFSNRSNKYFNEDVLAILSSVASRSEGNGYTSPRFMTQGSFAYNTLNYPDKPPQQQMDLDFGVYFPLTYVEDIADDKFQRAATVLRKIVEKCITDLVSTKPGWKFMKKEKCLRVIIASDAHIDLPIYSIPDKEFKTIVEQFTKLSFSTANMQNFMAYDSAKNVLLATDSGWIKSDPRVIYEWVKSSKKQHGDNFLFYSRYIKAWRDHQWEKTTLSSIMLMAVVCQAMQESDYQEQNNDVALNLEFVVRKFIFYLRNGGIKNPDLNINENLDAKLEDKSQILTKLTAFANHLNQATKTGDVKILIVEFGERFPNELGAVDVKKIIAPAVIVSPIATASPIKQSGVV